MKWLLVLLGLVLIVLAGAGLVASIDLLTTEIGAIYATCSAISAAAGLVILAMAALAHRIDALRAAILRQSEATRRVAAELDLAPPVPPPAAALEPTEPPPIPPQSAPEVEPTSAPPLAADAASMEGQGEERQPTTLVGRYSSGGANYSIFSDGSIEAETDQGSYRFASMSDFKAYIAAKRATA